MLSKEEVERLILSFARFYRKNDEVDQQRLSDIADLILSNRASEVGVQPEVMPKFMETIEEWEETMKMHIDDAIDKQEQQISEHYYKGREDAAKYAIEMIHKHLKLNKLSA